MIVLVYLSCHDKIPQVGWLKKQTFMEFPQWHSGLRIWRCLWGSLDSILGPRTSIGHGCGWKMKNQPTNQATKPSDIYSCTILEARSPRLRSKKFSFFWDLSCWLAFGQLSSELAMQKQRELCCLSFSHKDPSCITLRTQSHDLI